MINNFREFLLKILEIIDYSDNKELFLDKFEKNLQLQLVQNLIDTLPSDKKSETVKTLSSCSTEKQVSDVLQNTFSKNEIELNYVAVVEKVITEYVETLNPTLTQNQKGLLTDLFEKIQSENALKITNEPV